MALKAPSFMAETLQKKIGARRVVYDTGFGFRVQIEDSDSGCKLTWSLAPSARPQTQNPKPLTASMPRLSIVS